MTAKAPRSILLGLTGLGIGGGIASVSRCIVQALGDARSQGRLDRVDRVLLLDERSGCTSASRDGREWRCGGSQARFLLSLWWAIARCRPDLVLFDHLGLARSLLPRLPLPRPRYGVFVHGGELILSSEAVRSATLGPASILLANSPYSAEAIRSVRTLADKAPSVIPLCIEPARLRKWSELRLAPGAGPRKTAVLIVGRMWSEEPGKGHDALLDGWADVRARVPSAELWVVGTGDDQRRLEHKARQLGQAEHVRFFGGVSDETLSELYRTAALFAMPSRQEGFGLVYLEAMWHGLPCIGSSADAASCLIDDSCGRLVPYGDAAKTASAIVELLLDDAKRERLGDAGRRRAVEDFSFARFSCALRRALGIEA